MNVAVVGCTGLVGSVMLKILDERKFPVTNLIPVASEKSRGKSLLYAGKSYDIISAVDALQSKVDLALFSAGSQVSIELAPLFAKKGTVVIDNSSCWRMDPDVPLIVPEVNADKLTSNHKIIANPNCSTIQMVVALKPLHDLYGIKRIVVSTYQSVTGTGVKAVNQLMNERNGISGEMAYRYPIDLNVIPQIDLFLPNGYTKEEMKMVNETRKILDIPDLPITATTVRIPVMGGHSESVNVEFQKQPDVNEIRDVLSKSQGVMVLDNPAEQLYPMPLVHAQDRDQVFVGRIRIDESHSHALNLWIVSDNLRKGAATNAVQIATYLLEQGFLLA